MNYQVPLKLLCEYVMITSQHRKLLEYPSPAYLEIVSRLDTLKAKKHNEILVAVGTSREDRKFMIWFATQVEELLDSQNEITNELNNL